VFLLSFSYKFISLRAQDKLVFRLDVVSKVGISFESLLMHQNWKVAVFVCISLWFSFKYHDGY